MNVSEVGYGAWGIGGGLWQGSDDKESLQALHGAADLGLNFIDTALAYGDGHSERLIGRFLKERKDPITVATKVPPKDRRWPADPATPLCDAFPGDHILACAETSLANLGVERIDLLQFHVWNDAWADDDEWKQAVTNLKAQGKVRWFGISVNNHEPWNGMRAGESGLIDTYQVIYNIFDQTPEQDLFPYCVSRNIGVIVRVPFDEGSLTGALRPGMTFPDGDFRQAYFRDERLDEVVRRVEPLAALVQGEANSLAELALRFSLSHPAVSTVIPGMRKVTHVKENCAVSDGRNLSSELRASLKAHAWNRNFYQRR